MKMAVSPTQMKLNINSGFFSLAHKDAEIAYEKFLSCHLVENKNHPHPFIVSVRRSPCLGKHTKHVHLPFCHLCWDCAWQKKTLWRLAAWWSSRVAVLYVYLYTVLQFGGEGSDALGGYQVTST